MEQNTDDRSKEMYKQGLCRPHVFSQRMMNPIKKGATKLGAKHNLRPDRRLIASPGGLDTYCPTPLSSAYPDSETLVPSPQLYFKCKYLGSFYIRGGGRSRATKITKIKSPLTATPPERLKDSAQSQGQMPQNLPLK